MLALPPPISERVYLIANARRRGIGISLIARAIGISHQAVDQFITKYEIHREFVSVPVTHRSKLGPSNRIAKCARCGEIMFQSLSDRITQFCSRKCNGINSRLLNKKEIVWAIDQRRLNTSTWTGIARILGTDVQLVQRSIWISLYEDGLLTHSNVASIWRPAVSLMVKRGQWNWLIDSTGLHPTES